MLKGILAASELLALFEVPFSDNGVHCKGLLQVTACSPVTRHGAMLEGRQPHADPKIGPRALLNLFPIGGEGRVHLCSQQHSDSCKFDNTSFVVPHTTSIRPREIDLDLGGCNPNWEVVGTTLKKGTGGSLMDDLEHGQTSEPDKDETPNEVGNITEICQKLRDSLNEPSLGGQYLQGSWQSLADPLAKPVPQTLVLHVGRHPQFQLLMF